MCRPAEDRLEAYPTGFTLLELLLTLACVAALASVTIPAMTGLLGDQQLARGAAMVRGELMRTAAESVAAGQPMGLRRDGDRWVVGGLQTPDQEASATLQPIAGLTVPLIPTPEAAPPVDRVLEMPQDVEIIGLWTIPRGTSMPAPATVLRCYPDGVCDDARIQLRHVSLGDLFVNVRGISGEVSVDSR